MAYLDEIPITPITTVSSTANRTGTWRTFRPVIDEEKCIKCYTCWKFCPDVSILIRKDENGELGMVYVDYEHCKGCGICANECPVDAISMEKEV